MGKEELKFYVCKHCGNIITKVQNSGVPVVCCGEKMAELVPNTTDAATEKHVPEITVNGDEVVVKIGSVEHPMTEEHYIQWVYIQTEKGVQSKKLTPSDKTVVTFKLTDDDKLVAAYEYCNLHGLWIKDYQ
ncbi:desulfoferrodoxin family protein [Anaerosporobacter sp.]